VKLSFNKWSQERIKQGRKFCTSRTKKYGDKRVFAIVKMPLWIVRAYLWEMEGANSPKEFEKVWRSIHRGNFNSLRKVYVHFGDFNPHP